MSGGARVRTALESQSFPFLLHNQIDFLFSFSWMTAPLFMQLEQSGPYHSHP